MEWFNISSIVFAAIAIIGTVIALRQRKKSGPRKREEFYRQLKGLGLQVSLLENDGQTTERDIGRGKGQKSEGLIALENSNINLINIISEATQYGVNYFLDYIVEIPEVVDKKRQSKVRLRKKKEGIFTSRVTGIEWKGANPLAQRLSFDYSLEDMLVFNPFKGGIDIIPELKYGYTRIHTRYFLPDRNLFNALELIARDIRLEYGQRGSINYEVKSSQRNR
jgi:hypothetical protein